MTIPGVLDNALDFGVVPGYGRLGYAARGLWLASAPGGEVPSGLFWHDRRSRQTHRLPHTRETVEDRRLLWGAVAPAGAELPASARTPA